MNQQTKSAIKSLVLDLRHTLEKELANALRRYGLYTDRDWSLEAPPDRLTDPADREIWRRMVTVVKQHMREGRSLQEASKDYVREAAFTFLNRLVGLKCLEVRGIIDEIITRRDVYGGRSKAHRDYREAHPRQARAADDALPAAIEAAFRRVNDEMIGYLFDPDDDHSLVWPRYAVLKRCIARINRLDEAAWGEDEIIGWIYQFYNAEEKVEIRDRGKPQTPHDVAVINQFFTPRWIVKFLVDNTLGRLWLEMHPESERVRAKCDYLVPEPLISEERGDDKESGIQRERDEKAEDHPSHPVDPVNPVESQDDASSFALDPDSPINSAEAAPRREEKSITQIQLLDPACGTMHFGHYAMEVFAAMYRDARDWGHVQIEEHEIPGTILRNNLFGVDIDRRAVQLAALSLFMKARTLHPEASITQVNLVAADATLPNSGVRDAFLARYAKAPKVQQAFAQVLEDMDQVAELGSLLRVEERLRELLAEAGHEGAVEELRSLDPHRQRDLPGMEPPQRQLGLAELADDEEQAAAWTPHYTLRELRDDLRAFARRALDEHDLNAQLFATEADKAVRLLDVLMGEYDVVVMNPPYGNTTDVAKKYLDEVYPLTKNDLYAAFFEQVFDLLSTNGFLGALTSRTYLTLRKFQKLREELLIESTSPVAFLDLGFGVLDDATVETVGSAIRKRDIGELSQGVFIRLLGEEKSKKDKFSEFLKAIEHGRKPLSCYTAAFSDFSLIPRSPFAYWTSQSIRQLFEDLSPLNPDYADVRQGLTTANDKRFVRQNWEVCEKSIGRGKPWVPFAKGGDFSRYYSDIDLVVNWGSNGQPIKDYIVKRYPYLNGNFSWVVKNEEFYFREGLTYVYVTVKGFNIRYLPPGNIFGHAGNSVFPKNPEHIWPFLGLLNSSMVQFLLLLLTDSRKYEVGYVSKVPVPDPAGAAILHAHAQYAHDIKFTWDIGNEISTRFTHPWLLQLAQPERDAYAQGLGRVLELLGDDAPPLPVTPSRPLTLSTLLDAVRAIEQAADAHLQRLQAEIDAAVYDLYEISPADRDLIERELGDRPPELVWPQMEGKSDRAKRKAHVKRFLSYYVLQAVRADDDGIVPLAGCAAREPALMDRVRARLEAAFGPTTAYNLEQEAADYVGRDVETQLHTYFFHHFHADLYKKRPILWHLTSDKKHFAVMLDYHRLDRDTLPKVRSLYLWPQMEEVRTRLASARDDENVSLTHDLEEELKDLQAFEERLEAVIEGRVKVRLPTWANGPYRHGEPPYDPDLDDGVKVNLLPIQKARLLPIKKVV